MTIDPLQHIEGSTLFELVKLGKLVHPTNAKFTATAWIKAFKGLSKPTKRDEQLLFAALFLADQLSSLRNLIRTEMVKLQPTDAVDLVTGGANVQLEGILDRMRRKLQRQTRRAEVGFFGDSGDVLVTNMGGQKIAPDDAISTVVDALPNLLFHAADKDRPTANGDRNAALEKAALLASAASTEYGLHHLWQQALWESYSFTNDEDDLVISPTDERLAKLWLAWQRRNETILLQESTLNAGAAMVRDERYNPVPLISRSIVAIEERPGQAKRYIVGKARRNGHMQADMIDALKKTYIASFLDIPLPKPQNSGLTYRDLLRVWWVLVDVADLHRTNMGQRGLVSWKMIDRSVLRFSLEKLSSGMAEALDLTVAQVNIALNVFTTDPHKTSELFKSGCWGRPIVRAPHETHGRIVLGALSAPNPILTVERWMSATGVFDENNVVRGKVFEKFARERLKEAGRKNNGLLSFSVGSLPLPANRDGEEIDVLLRIGSTIVVGEAKCLNTPFSPQENYNHLRKIYGAVEQANRKVEWANHNLSSLLDALAIPSSERNRKWVVLPTVILNSPYGCGLKLSECPVTDLSWLAIVLGSREVVSGGLFVRGGGFKYQSETIYRSEYELEQKFKSLVVQPPSLISELARIQWRTVPFPTSYGKPLSIRTPASIGIPGTS